MTTDDAHTSLPLRVPGGWAGPGAAPKSEDHSAAKVNPVRQEPRYSLNLRSLGHMERLAKSRYVLFEANPDFDPSRLDPTDPEVARTVARTVFASSEIEGEGVKAEDLEPMVNAITQPGSHANTELLARAGSIKDIYDTYFWAFKQNQIPVISYDFVLEIHRRMFSGAQEEIAGRLKKEEVIIRWTKRGGETVAVPTVNVERTEEFLRALCDRTSAMFAAAQKDSSAPMILAAGEFMVDFLAIHPFQDGNGRAARLLTSYLLERAGYHFTSGYSLDQVVLDTRAEYYESLNRAQQNWHTASEDLTPWMNYFMETVFEQWERAYRRVQRSGAGPQF